MEIWINARAKDEDVAKRLCVGGAAQTSAVVPA
jgi:hypothetical protein